MEKIGLTDRKIPICLSNLQKMDGCKKYWTDVKKRIRFLPVCVNEALGILSYQEFV
jgi:hypothetical protein